MSTSSAPSPATVAAPSEVDRDVPDPWRRTARATARVRARQSRLRAGPTACRVHVRRHQHAGPVEHPEPVAACRQDKVTRRSCQGRGGTVRHQARTAPFEQVGQADDQFAGGVATRTPARLPRRRGVRADSCREEQVQHAAQVYLR